MPPRTSEPPRRLPGVAGLIRDDDIALVRERARIDDARIVISELVANSVRHAQPLASGGIEITWELERRGLAITVSDGGSGTRPRKVQAASSALAGRGMAIVESLALTWWADQGRARSTVHAILAV